MAAESPGPSACVLLVGHGGREVALSRALARSRHVASLVVTGANVGWPGHVDRTWESVDPVVDGWVRAAVGVRADLVVVGPEGPLAMGLSDALTSRGIPCFGPSAAAARIETSKAFAKEVMRAAGVQFSPTVLVEPSDPESVSVGWSRIVQGNVVIKRDGLAGGKGVFVPRTVDEARAIFEREVQLGETLLLEDRLSGHEVSLFAVSDGHRWVPLPAARDYKRRQDKDQGPNTGGMGAYAPALSADESEVLAAAIFGPVLREMSERRTPFRGVLYAGLMLTAQGPRVLEFNARFGDPEAQVILPLWQDDIYPWLYGAATGHLPETPLSFAPDHACGVVLTAPGYPDAPRCGGLVEQKVWSVASKIRSPKQPSVEWVPSSIVVDGEGNWRTCGGRVGTVVAVGDTRQTAREAVYLAITACHDSGLEWRTDVAAGPIQSLTNATRETPVPGVVLFQPRRGFRYGSEPFWLVGLALSRGTARSAVDLGTGSGIAACLLASQGLNVLGVEVREEWTPYWEQTLAESCMTGTVDLRLSDVRNVAPSPFLDSTFDVVVSNPPFFLLRSGPVSGDAWKAAARTESTATLRDFLAAGLRLLATEGRFYMVIPVERESDFLGAVAALGASLWLRVAVGSRRLILEIRRVPAPTERWVLTESDPIVDAWYARCGAPQTVASARA